MGNRKDTWSHRNYGVIEYQSKKKIEPEDSEEGRNAKRWEIVADVIGKCNIRGETSPKKQERGQAPGDTRPPFIFHNKRA